MARIIKPDLKIKDILRKSYEDHIIINDDCTKCYLCVEECPTDSISEGEWKMEVDDKTCILCKWCISVCPIEQISTSEMKLGNFKVKMKKKYWYSKEYPEAE